MKHLRKEHSCGPGQFLRNKTLAEFLKRNPIQTIYLVAAFLCTAIKNVQKHLNLTSRQVEEIYDYVKKEMVEINVAIKMYGTEKKQIPISEVDAKQDPGVLMEENASAYLSSDDCGDCEKDIKNVEQKDESPVIREFEEYLELKFPRSKFLADLECWKNDPSAFWCPNKHRFPLLSRLWRRVGSIKASSAYVERVFSHGGFVLMARRWNLQPESVSSIVMLHQWTKHNLV